MEKLLSGFQQDLGKLSDEIQHLHDQSADMSVKLKNRLAVKHQLESALDGMLIPPDMIREVCDDDVDNRFKQEVTLLEQRLQYLDSNQYRNPPITALKEVMPELERLRIKASEKIRAFFLDKIRSLSLPNTNVPIVHKTVLLGYTSLNHFLMERHIEAAKEVQAHYLSTMSTYYANNFSKYINRLQKLLLFTTDKNDLMGALDGATKKGLFGKIGPNAKSNLFSIGDRISILASMEAPVIIPHVADENQYKYTFESVFRSLTRTFMDNACSEYCFLSEFFSMQRDRKIGAPPRFIDSMFEDLFSRTTKLIYV